MLSGTINPYPEQTSNAQQQANPNANQAPGGRGRGSGRTNPAHTHALPQKRHQRNTRSEDLNILSHAQGQLRSHLEPEPSQPHAPPYREQDPALSHARQQPQQQQPQQQQQQHHGEPWKGPRHPYAWPPQPLHQDHQHLDRPRPRSAHAATAAAPPPPAAAASPHRRDPPPASPSPPGTQTHPHPSALHLDTTYTASSDPIDEDTVVQSIETDPALFACPSCASPAARGASSHGCGLFCAGPLDEEQRAKGGGSGSGSLGGRGESWVRRAGLKRESGEGGVGEGDGKRGRVGA
ncbi:hypothetical protein B5807_10469 [Epicoccum nigrum]|uniref:Uncharacterized protein n=1 Tax=Epicoccum nigrum TaxID=105696 RepID=A0A1Y2LLX6_EPING|nr:hypothetical protein B5807_10469 [Epicoccum nigrum]